MGQVRLLRKQVRRDPEPQQQVHLGTRCSMGTTDCRENAHCAGGAEAGKSGLFVVWVAVGHLGALDFLDRPLPCIAL